MNLRPGIVQGRLLPQEGGFIQTFPKDWLYEIQLAIKHNVPHIEWIVTNSDNPVFDDRFSFKHIPYKFSYVCLDVVNSTAFSSKAWLKTILEKCIDHVIASGMNNIVIPLLEKSSLALCSNEIRDTFIKTLSAILKKNDLLHISLETDLGVQQLTTLLTDIRLLSDNRKVYVTLDTGNVTRLGYNANDFVLNLSTEIDNIHIKDVISSDVTKHAGATTTLGLGVANIACLSKLLNDGNNVNRTFTFQTARDKNITEIDLYERNVKFINNILNNIENKTKG